MSEAPRLFTIHIACSGLDERDVFVVRSLLRIIDGRRNIGWQFHTGTGSGNAENAAAPADVLIAHSSIAEVYHQTPAAPAKLVWAFPDGKQPPAAAEPGLTLRYPLRAAELLALLDSLEGQWPFQTKTAETIIANTQIPTGQLASVAVTPVVQTPVKVEASVAAETGTTARASVLSSTVAARPSVVAAASQQQITARSSQSSASPPSLAARTTTGRAGLVERPDARRTLPPIALTSLASMSPMDGATVMRSSRSFLQPATVAALLGALYTPSSQGETRAKNVDIFGPKGWVARLRSGQSKAHVSSRFMLDRNVPTQAMTFQWKLVLGGVPPLEAGDTLIEVDLDLFAWQFASRFCHDFMSLAVPSKSTLQLKRWPDFGVLPEFSSRQGILLAVALLTREAKPLAEVSKSSGASEADLSCLLAACWLCGWLRCERIREKVTEKIPAAKQPTKGGFSAVVRSLRKVLGLSSRGS